MAEYLLDTSVLIDYLREIPAASEFLDSMPSAQFRTHTVVLGELIEGAKSRAELRGFDLLARRFRVLHPSEQDCINSLTLLRRAGLAHGVGWADCLIAATASRIRLTVATLNDKHFRVFRGLKVVRPY